MVPGAPVFGVGVRMPLGVPGFGEASALGLGMRGTVAKTMLSVSTGLTERQFAGSAHAGAEAAGGAAAWAVAGRVAIEKVTAMVTAMKAAGDDWRMVFPRISEATIVTASARESGV